MVLPRTDQGHTTIKTMQINHNKIAELPLFLGLSEKELTDISKTIRFNCRHHKKGSIIVEANTPCSSLVCVVDGWIEINTHAANHSYYIEELVQAVQMLEPDKLFGISPHYHSTYKAYVTCESVSISKEELTLLFERYMIVRLNFLNMICRRAQKLEQQQWLPRDTELKERIIMFIKHHSRYPAGKKVLHIKMAELAAELNVSRLEVSNTLNALHNEEKIIQRRGMIDIPALQLL